jgi:hypothetical protein
VFVRVYLCVCLRVCLCVFVCLFVCVCVCICNIFISGKIIKEMPVSAACGTPCSFGVVRFPLILVQILSRH